MYSLHIIDVLFLHNYKTFRSTVDVTKSGFSLFVNNNTISAEVSTQTGRWSTDSEEVTHIVPDRGIVILIKISSFNVYYRRVVSI